jgi:hypothetical protein
MGMDVQRRAKGGEVNWGFSNIFVFNLVDTADILQEMGTKEANQAGSGLGSLGGRGQQSKGKDIDTTEPGAALDPSRCNCSWVIS